MFVYTRAHVALLSAFGWFDGPLKALVPRCHARRLFSLHHLLKVGHDVVWAVHGNPGRPARANSLSPIDKCQRNDRQIEGWFDDLAFFFKEREHIVVIFVEQVSCNRTECCEDISGASCILASCISSSKLTDWLQEVDIVGTDESLS